MCDLSDMTLTLFVFLPSRSSAAVSATALSLRCREDMRSLVFGLLSYDALRSEEFRRDGGLEMNDYFTFYSTRVVCMYVSRFLHF